MEYRSVQAERDRKSEDGDGVPVHAAQRFAGGRRLSNGWVDSLIAVRRFREVGREEDLLDEHAGEVYRKGLAVHLRILFTVEVLLKLPKLLEGVADLKGFDLFALFIEDA